jgi:outer membrane receptor protein involved in Fe transport
MKRFTMYMAVVCASVCLFATAALSQTVNGTISGNVTDPAGAVVPGATVTAKSPDTGFSRSVNTDSNGNFTISGLPVGNYSVRVEKTGFKTAVNNSVLANVGSDTGLKFTLEAGSVEAVVQVTSSGEVLDTTEGQVVKTISTQQILELPGRNSLNGLALLNPGVLPNQNGRPGSGFAVNGNRTRSNNFTIDGANNNDQSLSIPRQSMPSEALEEFTIVTNTPKAEFGRNAGSYVNQITRSGTNRFTGTGFYTWAGNGYDALTTAQQRTFNAQKAAGLSDYAALRSARSVTADNTYGFTFGGPIKRDHTFFFTSFDWNDFRQTISSATRTALSPLAVQRLQYPGRLNVVPQAVNYLLTTFPVANQPTSVGSVQFTTGSPGSLSTCPANDSGTTVISGTTYLNCNIFPLQQFNRGLLNDFDRGYGTDFFRYLLKGNTRFSSKDNFSVRYLRDKSTDPGAPTSLPGEEIGQNVKNDSLTFNDAYTFSAKWLNEARFTFSRRNITFPENLRYSFSAGVTGLTHGNVNFPQFRDDKVYEATDNVSYNSGDHAVKFGYNLLIYKLNSFFAPNFRGTVSYPSLANFLTDTNASYSRYAGDGLTAATTYENSLFIQDDWRVNQDLNLNLGVRYEYITTPYGFFSNARPDVNNVGPRFGIAWNPKDKFGGRFVLRGGFGISYDQVFQNVLLNNSRNYPRGVNVAFTNINGQLPFINLPVAPTPAQYTGDPNLLPIRLFAPNTRVRSPRSTQWTLSMQYQLSNDWVAKVEYIGTQGRNLVREIETNYGFCGQFNPLSNTRTPCPTSFLTPSLDRIDPTRGSVLVGQGIANSDYHGLQGTLEKRLSRLNVFGANFGDLILNANYTYSVFMSESDDVLGGQGNRTLPADPRNPKLDRARSGFDQPHRFVMNFVWGLPNFTSNAWAQRIVGGWQISAVATYASGTPFSVLSANNALGILPGQISTVEGSQRVSVNPSGQYPLISVPTCSNGVQTDGNPNAYFILNCAGYGRLGNLGANTERTGGTQNWNLALVKNIRTFGERQRLQLRAEVFNALNHRNFTVIPANTVSSATNLTTFLNLGQTNVGGRGFTFGARYFF